MLMTALIAMAIVVIITLIFNEFNILINEEMEMMNNAETKPSSNWTGKLDSYSVEDSN